MPREWDEDIRGHIFEQNKLKQTHTGKCHILGTIHNGCSAKWIVCESNDAWCYNITP